MALHIHIGRPRKTRDRATVRRVRDAGLTSAEQQRLDVLYKRYESGPELSDREMDEFRKLVQKSDMSRDRVLVRKARDAGKFRSGQRVEVMTDARDIPKGEIVTIVAPSQGGYLVKSRGTEDWFEENELRQYGPW